MTALTEEYAIPAPLERDIMAEAAADGGDLTLA
jgi:hypothetical protein